MKEVLKLDGIAGATIQNEEEGQSMISSRETEKYTANPKLVPNAERSEDNRILLQSVAFTEIRHYVHNYLADHNNDEIAGFVKGVCNLESEVYSMIMSGEI